MLSTTLTLPTIEVYCKSKTKSLTFSKWNQRLNLLKTKSNSCPYLLVG
jgi:hypothetical protein